MQIYKIAVQGFKNKFDNSSKKRQTPSFKAGLHKDVLDISACKKLFLEQNEMFPQDKIYRKALAKILNIKNGEEYLLRPIIGIQELVSALKQMDFKNFMPGARKSSKFADDRDLSLVKSGEFLANLHCHSKHSNEEPLFAIKIKDLTEQASALGDINAKIIETKTGNTAVTPFVVGITDHNTVKGNIETINLVKENPYKYKNARIILGCEIDTKACADYPNMHILFYGLNPAEEIEVASNSFKDIITGLSNSKFGAIGIAHPARYVDSSLSEKEIKVFYTKLFSDFKKFGKDKAIFIENNYQGYLGEQKRVAKIIKKVSDEFGFISTGGLDSHGNNIFTEQKALSEREIRDLTERTV